MNYPAGAHAFLAFPGLDTTRLLGLLTGALILFSLHLRQSPETPADQPAGAMKHHYMIMFERMPLTHGFPFHTQSRTPKQVV